jgi:hypothetical protein
MWWKLLQLTVFLAVSFTGIYYEWTPNGLVLGLVAATCAFAVTVLLGDLFRFLAWAFKPRSATLAKKGDKGRLTSRR